MYILFNDVMQDSGAPRNLKSPALAETYEFEEDNLAVEFGKPAAIDCVGIGNCSIREVTVIARIASYTVDGGGSRAGHSAVIDGGGSSRPPDSVIDGNPPGSVEFTARYEEDGLYLLQKNAARFSSVVIVAPKGATIGRLALGKAVGIPTSVAKEPGFFSTSEPRRTLSGQVIPGAGGYNYRAVSLDSRYKIGREAMEEIAAGYKASGAGYPFFIDLSAESYKLPFRRLYAAEKSQRAMSFESGVRRFLYSRRFNFEEAF